MPQDASTIADQLLLGRYRVLEERGKGGFGDVSICWDPRLMRRVAIKTIPLHMVSASPAQKRRRAATPPNIPAVPDTDTIEHNMLLRAALAETRTASMLAHPNIVSMLDFESDDENAYIIMEYVEGASLAELLDATEDGLLTSDEAAAVVEAVCDALQFAHDNGVLHLDIKPDNILIDMSGRVKLADFGMAALSSATGYAGARGGTVGYMPPEQITCADVDVRTDVFAFASVMYEALTGVRLFAAATPQESLELVESGTPDPCALNESLSPQAADALLIALDPDPTIRPSSAEAFADEMMPGLGRAKAGRKSLASFVADVLDDSEPDANDVPLSETNSSSRAAAAQGDPDLGPLAKTLPRFAPILLRIVGACAAGGVAGRAIQTLVASGEPYAAIVAAILVVILGIAAPALGYALAIAALVVGCIVAEQWAWAAVILVLGALWWGFIARKRPYGSSAALAGAAAGGIAVPVPPMICGWLLPAGGAALSAAVGYVTAEILVCLNGTPAVEIATSVSFWLMGCAWVGSAAVMGALCHKASKMRCYLGCVVSGAVLAIFELVAARMENDGSWASLAPEVAAAVIGSTILAALCVFMLGSSAALDVDGRDEGVSAHEDARLTKEGAPS